jgi:hypothetical protein
MSFSVIADEGSESGASTTTHTRESRGRVVSSNGENTDVISATMEWRRMVLQSQEEESQLCQAMSIREGRWRAKLEAEIQKIRRHFHTQEKVLEREIVALEQKYEWTIAQLETEDPDEVSYFVGGWEAQSDYQPTECGEGSGSLVSGNK